MSDERKIPGSLLLPLVAAWGLLSLCPVWLQASEGKGRFEHFTNRDGLSQTSAIAIVEDQRGFLWVGTQGGLNRFDGYEFKTFRNDPKDPGSLSADFIVSMCAARDGAVWIGTFQGGLNRLDTETETFTRFRADPDDPRSLSGNLVLDLFEDRQGSVWAATTTALSRYDAETGGFDVFRHHPDDPRSLAHNEVLAVRQDGAGRIWVGTVGGLDRFDAQSGSFVHYQPDPADPDSLSHRYVQTLLADPSGGLWVGTQGGGLNFFEPETEAFRHYRHNPSDPDSIGSDDVRSLYLDRAGVLWVGTGGGGLNRFDPDSGSFTRYRHDPSDPESLSNNEIRSIIMDRAGSLWVGTLGGGLNRLDLQGPQFVTYRHDPFNPDSLSHNFVRSILEDRTGAVWVGTRGGGLNKMDPASGKFTHFRHNPSDPHSLGDGEVYALHQSQDGTLWVGLWKGLDRYDPRTGRFSHYRHDPQDPRSLADDQIMDLLDAPQGELWISTRSRGLDRFDPASGVFTHYGQGAQAPRSLKELLQDQDGTIWVGTSGSGLSRFHPQRGFFAQYRHDPDDPRSLSNNIILCLHKDRSGALWVGTRDGLNRFDAQTESFTRYTQESGLPDDVIYGILEDDLGRFWLSTNRGLARFDPAAQGVTVYDSLDGLQDNEFNQKAFHRASNGRMYFGGVGGMTAFRGESIHDNDYLPPIVLTSFRIFDREADLAEAPAHIQQIDLGYRDNFFSFEFAALSFRRPDKNRYAYKLEGFDADWIQSGTRRYASYTNVPPGDYQLRVKGSNNDGLWNDQGVQIAIAVQPPPWRTWWAYAFYFLATVGIVVGYVSAQQRKLAREREVSQRLRQVDRLKDEFLANTSHELRTPLHGIIGLAESLLDGSAGEMPPQSVSELKMIRSSGKRLSRLVDDLLDFSQLKNRSLQLRKRPVDLRAVADVVLTHSAPLAAGKPLQLINSIDPSLPPAEADEDRLQQILYNLVGNAIKFTEKGKVELSAGQSNGQLMVQVADSGIGIAPEKQQRIFESFEQADGSTAREYGGTGLGLAITRQLVELHGGSIGVESSSGKGASFTFSLPVAQGKPADSRKPGPETSPVEVFEALSEPEKTEETALQPSAAASSRFNILIVDDDPVNRHVLANHLRLRDHRVAEAASGPEALAKLDSIPVPDLVLLDIMMPRMSGYQVCRKLRQRYPMSRLPVIFLTAKNRAQDVQSGFGAGGNDYLTKPTSKEELLSRVHLHLDLLDINRNLEEKVNQRTEQLKARMRELEEALRHIETLRGILPICMHCKKIRDDEGFWEQVETYVSKHSDAQFSHGICPECYQKHWGDGVVSES